MFWKEISKKGFWTKEEDEALSRLVKERGEGKWAEIAREMKSGRTDNQCWRRYRHLMDDSQVKQYSDNSKKRKSVLPNYAGRENFKSQLSLADLELVYEDLPKKKPKYENPERDILANLENLDENPEIKEELLIRFPQKKKKTKKKIKKPFI